MSLDTSRLDELKIDRSDERPSRRPLWIAAGVLLLVAAVLAFWQTRPRSVEVRTAEARAMSQGADRTVLNASGYVVARRKATVSSKVTGKVVEVLIEEGMSVEQDQLLASLDDSNVRASYELAAAQLRVSKESLTETRVALAEAELDFSRVVQLRENQIASQADLDKAQAQVDSLKARLRRQEEEISVSDRQVSLWRQQLTDTEIRAPFAGVIVAKNAQPGEMISPVSAGGGFTRTGIGTLVDMSSLEIEVDVNESYINRVAAGQPVEATLDSYADWKIPARVIAIVPTADRQKATVRVRIGFEELDERILPDMGVKVAFRDSEPADDLQPQRLVKVPIAALRMDDDREVVFVLSGGAVERRAVNVVTKTGEMASVSAGLSGGERVVVEGPPQLEDGDAVREVSE